MAKEKTIKEKQKDLAKSTLITGIFTTILLLYAALMISAYMYDNPRTDIGEALANLFPLIIENPLYFFPISYDISAAICLPIMSALFTFMGYTINKLRVHHDINTLKGSAKWADIKEMVHKYADFEGNNYKTAYNNAILSENFQMSINQGKHFHALNTLILGATGSGKSRYFLKPNLLQMNCSYVITDPSGGILQECGEALRRFGYKVKVFDLVQMGNCDSYNPLKYCKKESDIKKVVQAFMTNTSPDGKAASGSDPFWDNSTIEFLCAGIALLTTCPEGYDIPYAQIPDITGGFIYEPCFATLCEFARMANRKWEPSCGIQPFRGAKLGDGKNNTANASELALIFSNLEAWECVRQDCDKDELIKPYCLKEWENFRMAPEKTSTTILMTTAVRLDPFNIEQVRNLTSSDTLDLNNFGNQKEALFVITPTNDRTYNFIVSFLYTQLFDILYQNGETKSAGSMDLKLPNGELVRHFPIAQVTSGDYEEIVKKLKNVEIERVEGGGIKDGEKTIKKKTLFGKVKKVKVPAKFDDGWYEIKTADGELVTRRPTKELAEQYVKDLSHAKLIPGNGKSVPTHVRFLLDEFPNLGQIPEFKEKLATMRKYEISCTVICQSITQLKGMYEKDYEVVDANCPQTIFLGGDENTNNEYISKKIGTATVKGANNSIDKSKVNSSYNVEQRELMRPEELGKMPFDDQIILVYGENPIYDKKYNYPAHKNYKFTHDYACDLGINDASVFDRTPYQVRIPGPLVYKAEVPTAIPSVERLDSPEKLAEKFRTLFAVNDNAEVITRMENNYRRYGFESDSEEGEF